MIFNTLTPKFRYILDLFLISLKKHQYIGFYYDFSGIDPRTTGGVKSAFSNALSSYYNLLGFTDFVPGFLTNVNGGGLPRTRTPLVFMVLLNFNYRNPKHRNLLDEIIFAKIEYIIISATDMDLVRYKPYLFIKADLSNMKALEYFLYYLTNYLKLNLPVSYHKIRAEDGGKFKYKMLLINYVYLISVLRNSKNILYEIAIYLYSTKTKFRLSDFSSIRTCLKYFTYPTKIKIKFYNKCLSRMVFMDSLYRNRKAIRDIFFQRLKGFLMNAKKIISFTKLKELLRTFRKHKLTFV